MQNLLVDIREVSKSASIGNKAKSIQILLKKKYRVPKTYVVLPYAHESFKISSEPTLSKLKTEIESNINLNKPYAIRSSASIEDQTDYSFAGQFTSILGVNGVDDMVSAVTKVWRSAEEPGQSSYAQTAQKQNENITMSVMIQEMVESLWSGVAFSINPVNGRNEIVIEAVKGLGDSLVQDGITPSRWIFSQGNWENLKEEESPGITVLNQLADDITRLKFKSHHEIDIEWAYDGQDLNYLQLRSVTTSKFPTVYTNHLSREFLPGLIKPLVWSVNIPLVNSAWIKLLEQVVGNTGIKPEHLSRAFHYRAYFNMGTMGAIFEMMGLPKNALESLMGRKDPSGKSSFKPTFKTFLLLPRMIWFVLSNLNIAKKFDRTMKGLNSDLSNWEKRIETDFKIEKFESYHNEIFELCSPLAYFNIVIPLLMHLTNNLFRKQLKKMDVSYSDLFLYHQYPAIKEYDPQLRLAQLYDQWVRLNEEQKEAITKSITEVNGPHDVNGFGLDYRKFMESFGHFSESGNDFSVPTWKEDQEFVLNVLMKSSSTTPISRETQREVPSDISQLSKSRKLLRKCRRAAKYRLLREKISSEYIRGYGLFRKLFVKVGQHFQENGIIDQANDIFYLNLDEVKLLVHQFSEQKPFNPGKHIQKIKQEMQEAEHITLPAVIYGEDPPLIPKKNERLLEGIPISPGHFEGHVVVVNGYKDFHKSVEGCVLIIPFSDVSWTPILTKAGAIVSESGGILSHASIVARELGIPAIASVDHACRIQDGTQVKLDCNHGRLIIQSE